MFLLISLFPVLAIIQTVLPFYVNRFVICLQFVYSYNKVISIYYEAPCVKIIRRKPVQCKTVSVKENSLKIDKLVGSILSNIGYVTSLPLYDYDHERYCVMQKAIRVAYNMVNLSRSGCGVVCGGGEGRYRRKVNL